MRGVAAHQASRLDEAELFYKAILQVDPEHADANHNMGVLLMDCGHSLQAEHYFKTALKTNPGVEQYWISYLNLLIKLGSLSDAESILDRAQAKGFDSEGLRTLRDILTSRNNTKDEEPPSETISKLMNLLNQGEHARLIEAADEVLKMFPRSEMVLQLAAGGLQNLGQLNEAVACYDRIVDNNPDNFDAYYNRGVVLKKLNRLEQALGSYEKVIALKPDHMQAYVNSGNILSALGRWNAALQYYDKAVQINPESAVIHFNLGNACKSLGNNRAAIDSYNNALKIDPQFAEAYRNLSLMGKGCITGEQASNAAMLYDTSSLPDAGRMHLAFALGKIYEDQADYAHSFSCYKEGNKIRRSLIKYDRKAVEDMFSRSLSLFGVDSYPVPEIVNQAEKKNIFILGMPRSGTTLVEQIVSSHSDVYGAGELPFMQMAFEQSGFVSNGLSTERLSRMRDIYLEEIDRLETGLACVTDKMPHNFLYIGNILLAIPEAKIIHVRRDARAVCWSIYRQYFVSQGNEYAYDMNDIVAFYKMYYDLMKYWHDRFPDRIYELDYEMLTGDQENETSKLLSYLGLEWEDACMNFYNNKRGVHTASNSQVRNRMYTGSSLQWKNYEPYLEEMIEALRDY